MSSFAEFMELEKRKKIMNNNYNNIHKNNFSNTPGQNNYNFKVIEKNLHKEQPKIEKLSTQNDRKCVIIDSRDRNRNIFPQSNKFRVHVNPSDTFEGAGLFTNLKNVESIKLIECTVPDFTGSHAYLNLIIPELQDTMLGTNDKLKKSFAILFPDDINGNFVSCKTKDLCCCKKDFDPPLANINRLTFEFYTPEGTLVNFGSDTSPPTAPNSIVQVTLVLEIKMLKTNKNVLESRPIF